MLAVRLESELESQLDALAKLRQRSKSDLVREAILRMLEDVEDAELAEAALAQSQSSKPLARIRKERGLDG
ncbi:MAG: ribbon-helix-helix protein, CopG family [Nitrosomonadales bacterium]|nr:MAG: ribbon-helix-helix protein, CopG family [Nitrosomonadales bacterium]